MKRRTLTSLIGGIAMSLFALFAIATNAAEAQEPVTLKSVQGDLVVPEGQTAVYDSSRGALVIGGRIINNGKISIIGSSNAVIEAKGLTNNGEIRAASPNLTLRGSAASTFKIESAQKAVIYAKNEVLIVSSAEIVVQGGSWKARKIRYSSKDVKVHALRIDGAISIESSKSFVGVDEGDLNVSRNDGDPLYYNFSGNVTAPGYISTGNIQQDYVAIASGKVTVTGAVQTNGQVRIAAGVNFRIVGASNGAPTSGSGVLSDALCIQYALTTCAQAVDNIGFNSSTSNLVTQAVSAGRIGVELQASGTITTTGDLTTTDATGEILTLSHRDQHISGNIAGPNSVGMTTDKNGIIYVGGKITSTNGGVIVSAGIASTPPSSAVATVQIVGDITALDYVDVLAGSDVSLNNLYAGGSTNPGSIGIYTNESLNSSEFVIGSAAGTNHVLSLNVSTDTGGGADVPDVNGTPQTFNSDEFVKQTVLVQNLGSGGVTIQNGSAITLSATNSETGAIAIDASKGKLKLNGGTLSVNGGGSNSAGQIALHAAEIDLTNGSSITADTASTRPQNHYVLIATDTFSFSGNTTLSSSGDAGPNIKAGLIFNTYAGSTFLFNLNSLQVRQSDSLNTAFNFYSPDGSTLTTYTDGANAQTFMEGKSISFNIGAANFNAYGANVSQKVHYVGTANGTTSLNFIYGTVNFYADGNNANAGTITVEADNIMSSSNGSVGLYAQSLTGSPWNGGTISVTAYSADLSKSVNYIDASSLTNGDGGNISLSISQNIDLQKSYITTNGMADGSGGQVTVTGGSTIMPMVLDGATISASAGSGKGNGNQILITNSGPISVDGTTLNAKGGGSGGNGGKVTLHNPGEPNYLDVSNLTINANATKTTDGQGGLVMISDQRNSNPINFVSQFNVDGGMNNPTRNAGTVSLNSVVCKQVVTTYSPFPTSYWNCVTPPTDNDGAPAYVGSKLASVQSKLDPQIGSATQTQIVVFNNSADYGNFFGLLAPQDPNVAGYTFQLADERIYSTIYESVNSVALNNEQISETADHELGHAVDVSQSYAYSHGQNYSKYLSNDLRYLDYIGGNQATPRPACSSNGSAPFDNVLDMTSGTPLCDPTTHKPKYAYSNSRILKTTTRGIFARPATINIQEETFAQTFSFLAYVNTSLNTTGTYLFASFDPILKKMVPGQTYSYFACTQSISAAVLGGTKAAPAYCSSAKPSWYTPYK